MRLENRPHRHENELMKCAGERVKNGTLTPVTSPKKVLWNPPKRAIKPLQRFDFNPKTFNRTRMKIWPPKRSYITLVKGSSVRTTDRVLLNLSHRTPPPFQVTLLQLSLHPWLLSNKYVIGPVGRTWGKPLPTGHMKALESEKSTSQGNKLTRR